MMTYEIIINVDCKFIELSDDMGYAPESLINKLISDAIKRQEEMIDEFNELIYEAYEVANGDGGCHE